MQKAEEWSKEGIQRGSSTSTGVQFSRAQFAGAQFAEAQFARAQSARAQFAAKIRSGPNLPGPNLPRTLDRVGRVPLAKTDVTRKRKIAK